jgi:hypothetical protein
MQRSLPVPRWLVLIAVAGAIAAASLFFAKRAHAYAYYWYCPLMDPGGRCGWYYPNGETFFQPLEVEVQYSGSGSFTICGKLDSANQFEEGLPWRETASACGPAYLHVITAQVPSEYWADNGSCYDFNTNNYYRAHTWNGDSNRHSLTGGVSNDKC